MAGSPFPATGEAWNTAVPDNSQVQGKDYNEHRETKLAVGIRMAKEHVAFAGSSVGGEHKMGSAVPYRGDYSSAAAGDNLPTTKPDGSTALDSDDAGRIAYDTNGTYGGVFYMYSGSAWVQFPFVLLTTAQTVAGVKTFSSFPVTPSSAPTTNYQVANKKYIDDKVTSYQFVLRKITTGTKDFTVTCNDAWNNVDLSSIVTNEDAVAVMLNVKFSPSAHDDTVIFRKNGEASPDEFTCPGVGGCYSTVDNHFQQIVVECDSSRITKAKGSNGASCTITVQGWYRKIS